MKKPALTQRASHVNEGTAVAREDLAWPEGKGPVLQLPKLHAEIEPRVVETRYGGLALVEQFYRKFGVAEEINERVHVLKQRQPYSESDHVLAQTMNLYVGGRSLEGMASLQNDEAVCRLLGACRLPDPTTAGDFSAALQRRRAGWSSACETGWWDRTRAPCEARPAISARLHRADGSPRRVSLRSRGRARG